ncbi:MAG: hypothetical protein ABI651_14160, partial [Verrucomicrobiota bacterium]
SRGKSRPEKATDANNSFIATAFVCRAFHIIYTPGMRWISREAHFEYGILTIQNQTNQTEPAPLLPPAPQN